MNDEQSVWMNDAVDETTIPVPRIRVVREPDLGLLNIHMTGHARPGKTQRRSKLASE